MQFLRKVFTLNLLVLLLFSSSSLAHWLYEDKSSIREILDSIPGSLFHPPQYVITIADGHPEPTSEYQYPYRNEDGSGNLPGYSDGSAHDKTLWSQIEKLSTLGSSSTEKIGFYYDYTERLELENQIGRRYEVLLQYLASLDSMIEKDPERSLMKENVQAEALLVKDLLDSINLFNQVSFFPGKFYQSSRDIYLTQMESRIELLRMAVLSCEGLLDVLHDRRPVHTPSWRQEISQWKDKADEYGLLANEAYPFRGPRKLLPKPIDYFTVHICSDTRRGGPSIEACGGFSIGALVIGAVLAPVTGGASWVAGGICAAGGIVTAGVAGDPAPHGQKAEAFWKGFATGVSVVGVVGAVQSEKQREVPQFSNTRQNEKTFSTPELTYDDLRSTRSDTYIYIIDEQGKLHLSKSIRDKEARVPRYAYDTVYHSDLALNSPVLAAGEVVVTNGRILEINNNSGHYQPQGEHLPSLIESTFVRQGYHEAHGKFVDHWRERQAPQSHIQPNGLQDHGESSATKVPSKQTSVSPIRADQKLESPIHLLLGKKENLTPAKQLKIIKEALPESSPLQYGSEGPLRKEVSSSQRVELLRHEPLQRKSIYVSASNHRSKARSCYLGDRHSAQSEEDVLKLLDPEPEFQGKILDLAQRPILKMKDFDLYFESPGKSLPVKVQLPIQIKQNVIQFLKNNPNHSDWMCRHFVNAAHGIKHGVFRNKDWDVHPWGGKDTSNFSPGDVAYIKLPLPNAPGCYYSHVALYLREGQFISKYGEGPLVISTLKEMGTEKSGAEVVRLTPKVERRDLDPSPAATQPGDVGQVMKGGGAALALGKIIASGNPKAQAAKVATMATFAFEDSIAKMTTSQAKKGWKEGDLSQLPDEAFTQREAFFEIMEREMGYPFGKPELKKVEKMDSTQQSSLALEAIRDTAKIVENPIRNVPKVTGKWWNRGEKFALATEVKRAREGWRKGDSSMLPDEAFSQPEVYYPLMEREMGYPFGQPPAAQ